MESGPRKKAEDGKIHRAKRRPMPAGTGRESATSEKYEHVCVLWGSALRARVGAFPKLGLQKATILKCLVCQNEFAVPGEGKRASDQAWRRWSISHPLCAFSNPVRRLVHPPHRDHRSWHAHAEFATHWCSNHDL